MRGLIGLLAAIVLGASVVLFWPEVTGSSSTAECAAAAAVCGGGATAVREQSAPTTAVPPPGDDDPNRPHVDPGVWPDLVFILGLFAFALVMRGSRRRPRSDDPDDLPDRREP